MQAHASAPHRVKFYFIGEDPLPSLPEVQYINLTDAAIKYNVEEFTNPNYVRKGKHKREEGVKINWLRTIREIDSTTFQVEVMEVDENGRPQPTGEIETLEADALVLALGVTGMVTEMARLGGFAFVTYATYFLHLILIWSLFAYTPFSKLAHLVYRTTAMTYNEYIGRK